MEIKLINEVWFVNNKPLTDLTSNEILLLDQFFEEMKNSLKL
jgi:hypothetical protein